MIIIEAFDSCKYLKTVNFEKDCQLEVIEKYAFKNTSIESISIPQKTKSINEGAFKMSQLQKISFKENASLEYIGKDAFSGSFIKEFYISENIKYLV